MKLLFFIKGFRTIVFISIVIFTTFQPICPPDFFRCLSNLGSFTELRATSFIESTGVACSDSVCHSHVLVLSISVLLLGCSQDWTCNLQIIVSLEPLGANAYNRYAMCPNKGWYAIKHNQQATNPSPFLMGTSNRTEL